MGLYNGQILEEGKSIVLRSEDLILILVSRIWDEVFKKSIGVRRFT